jgi:pimeloyl-ACP methyl ester carboxylesterase
MIGVERTLPDVMPGGGHWTPEENPEFLVPQALRFLGR